MAFTAINAFAMICAFWLLQPLIMFSLVVQQPRSKIVVALAIFVLGTKNLADILHSVREPDADMSVLWTLFALQCVKYVHAVAVGGEELAQQFGLTSFSRVALFTLSVPTLVFFDAPVTGSKGNSMQLVLRELVIGVLGVAAMVGLCQATLYFQLDTFLPNSVQLIIYMYITALSCEVGTLLYEIPVRLLLLALRNNNQVMVIPIIDNPILSSSPRDLWRRWTCCAGYHFRKGFYEPLLRKYDKNNRLMATTVPFVVNCLVHIFCWGYWIQGNYYQVQEWVVLLVIFPLTTIWIQDNVLGPRGFFGLGSSWASQVFNYLLMLGSAILIFPVFLQVQLLPTTLRELALKNTGQ